MNSNPITYIFVKYIGKRGGEFYRAHVEYVDNETGEILVGITEYYSKDVLEMVVDDALAHYPMAKVLKIEKK